jgi:hypothetical protein
MDIIYKLILEHSDIIIGMFFGFCLGNIFQIWVNEKMKQ